MTTEIEFKQVGSKLHDSDSLHFGSKRNSVTAYINIIGFVDKDTNQNVMYCPSFDVTSYGKTKEKAQEMMKEALHDLLESFIQLTPGQLKKQLVALGWKPKKLRNKDFSKMFVDLKGNLQNFNAVEDSVERLALVS